MRSFVLSRARSCNYPGICQEVEQLIGEEATEKLIAEYGGVCLYIPGNLNDENHPLCLLLGKQAAQHLADEFGGMQVYLPRNIARKIAQRNTQIMLDKESGMSQRDLARKYRMTTRNIRNITNKYGNRIAPHAQ